ncbi:MAG: radical SAM family heme chaperone HemW [Anaerolineales bacterium]|nr:radical SAM family heme chaperone HemW [Anaerolineales bacterium]
MTYALYLHIPFCRVRCTYCAFNTYADHEHLMDGYVAALIKEIRYLPPHLPAHTIYFGGGTPSLLSSDQIAAIVEAIRGHFQTTPTLEITVEANPGTVDTDRLQGYRAAGVNRLSIGMQSAHPAELSMFGRLHGVDAVAQTVHDARQAGFDNLSLDLIYGVPLQTREMWQASLHHALSLAPDHLSLYALSLEAGTELARRVKYQELPLPDSDLAADMYDDATALLAEAGFIQYEISNWSREGKECQHNIQYWRNLPYFGLGAGAHGYVNQTRTVNAMRPEVYIQRLEDDSTTSLPFPQTPATIKAEALDTPTDMGETVFMGLRLLQEGLSLEAFAARYGERFETRFGEDMQRLIQRGLLSLEDDCLKLTPSARLISNYVFQHFVEVV